MSVSMSMSIPLARATVHIWSRDIEFWQKSRTHTRIHTHTCLVCLSACQSVIMSRICSVAYKGCAPFMYMYIFLDIYIYLSNFHCVTHKCNLQIFTKVFSVLMYLAKEIAIEELVLLLPQLSSARSRETIKSIEFIKIYLNWRHFKVNQLSLFYIVLHSSFLAVRGWRIANMRQAIRKWHSRAALWLLPRPHRHGWEISHALYERQRNNCV